MKIVVGIIGFIVILLCVEIYRELHSFRVVCYPILSEKLMYHNCPYRIVFLSDLHNQAYGKENEKLYSEICRQNPDVVLIGGDMLIGKEECPHEKALKLILKLADHFEIYYAMGNHEQRIKEEPFKYGFSIDNYKEKLRNAGVHFLENEHALLETRCGKISIAGLEIPERCYVRFHKVPFSANEISQMIGTADPEIYQILMAHNPTYMNSYLEWGADLTLSGHFHGGVARIPGIEGVISPAFRLFPKYSGGHYKEGEKEIVVSKGLGVHTIKLRIFNPAEFIVLEMNGK